MTPRTLQVLGEALIAAAEKLDEELRARCTQRAGVADSLARTLIEGPSPGSIEAAVSPELRRMPIDAVPEGTQLREDIDAAADVMEESSGIRPDTVVLGEEVKVEEGPKLDKLGRPWSKEVHSGGKRINKGDGRWSLKRGVTREQEDAHFALVDALGVETSRTYAQDPYDERSWDVR